MQAQGGPLAGEQGGHVLKEISVHARLGDLGLAGAPLRRSEFINGFIAYRSALYTSRFLSYVRTDLDFFADREWCEDFCFAVFTLLVFLHAFAQTLIFRGPRVVRGFLFCSFIPHMD